jgi:hypothetical protein
MAHKILVLHQISNEFFKGNWEHLETALHISGHTKLYCLPCNGETVNKRMTSVARKKRMMQVWLDMDDKTSDSNQSERNSLFHAGKIVA